MKKVIFYLLILISNLTTLDLIAQTQENCNYFCPLLNDVTIIEAQGCPEVVPYIFSLQNGYDKLCSGETFTFTLKSSSGTVIASHNTTNPYWSFPIANLCSGNYTICITLNSSFRDCGEQCDTFYLYNNTGCCSDQ